MRRDEPVSSPVPFSSLVGFTYRIVPLRTRSGTMYWSTDLMIRYSCFSFIYKYLSIVYFIFGRVK
nr:hypothetical protein Q903MT_gene6555 [Picea sitchensis]